MIGTLAVAIDKLAQEIEETIPQAIAEILRLRQQNAELREAGESVLTIWQRCYDDGIDLSYMDEPIARLRALLARSQP